MAAIKVALAFRATAHPGPLSTLPRAFRWRQSAMLGTPVVDEVFDPVGDESDASSPPSDGRRGRSPARRGVGRRVPTDRDGRGVDLRVEVRANDFVTLHVEDYEDENVRLATFTAAFPMSSLRSPGVAPLLAQEAVLGRRRAGSGAAILRRARALARFPGTEQVPWWMWWFRGFESVCCDW